jgi:hypothetical protein
MCFSIGWLVQLLVWLVVICGLVAILRLLLPIMLGWLGWAGGVAMQVINIIIAVIVIRRADLLRVRPLHLRGDGWPSGAMKRPHTVSKTWSWLVCGSRPNRFFSERK